MNWLLTALLSFVAYTLFSWYGMRTGTANSAVAAGLAPVRDPLNFALIAIGTIAFSLALFYGNRASDFAVTVVIAIGVLVSFAFSAAVGGVQLAAAHFAAIALILGGIYLLK